MEFISVKEAANKWGYSEATVRKWCKAGRISITTKAEKKNGRWQIPSNAECPKTPKK